MEKIKIENLTFCYAGKDEPAIENINITVASGEFICICGKSGCGKSTLLRQLKPLLSPHGKRSGTIYWKGRDISALSQAEQAKNIGFVLQNPDSSVVCDKVWHELAFGLESLSFSDDEIRAGVAEMASFFGINDLYHKNVNELSGGQKQLLNLASVMVMQPEVLILDEPTGQLDPIASQDFLDALRKINIELGTTVIISEHRLEQAIPLADRVIVMDNGMIIADGDVQSVSKILRDTKNDMLAAFPTPIRVYCSLDNPHPCPITVREGKEWLSKMPLKTEVKFTVPQEQNNSTVALTAKDLRFRYEKDSPDILKGFSLKIFEGEFYAIVGGNGSGKTTALSALTGINTPYCGIVKTAGNKKIIALPQNPQNLFLKKTVRLDLLDMLSGDTKNITKEKFEKIVSFCELERLLDSHPFDLSGGEQQRAALAKVLLCEPDILLLDEPTKGLDVHFKQKLASMLKSLQKNGVTIIMVSHDIEFSAMYADRLGMFFDGQIVSENTPRAFFAGKSFYTTAANRMARHIRPDAVIAEDIIEMVGGEEPDPDDIKHELILTQKPAKSIEPKKKKITRLNIMLGIIFAILFGITAHFTTNDYTVKSYILQITGILLLAFSLYNFIPKNITPAAKQSKPSGKIPKRTLLTSIIILLLIPLTIFVGERYLGGRKYYFISLMIILETMLPFMLIFEGRKPNSRELVIISVLSAVAVAGRIAFAMLPQFKPVLALIIISGVCLGGESGFLVGAITAFVSNFYFTQGVWTPWQMFVFGIVGFLAGIFYRNRSVGKVRLSVFGFFATIIIYGGIMNPASVIMYQEKITIEMLLTSYIGGFPLDLIHAVSTAFFLWFGAEPICEKLERVKMKYSLDR